MKILAIVSFVLCVAVSGASRASRGRAATDTLLPITASNTTTFLYDSLGRIRLFQGINMVTKQPPWFDPSLTDPAVIADLVTQGITVIRLGLMWTGAEPSAGR